jgi:hypothetical protein
LHRESGAYLLEADLPDSARTEVLVLATEHLRGLGDDFDPAVLTSLLDVLVKFGPGAIGVEALPPVEIRRLSDQAAIDPDGAAAQIVAAFAGEVDEHGQATRAILGLTSLGAGVGADALLDTADLSQPPIRRSLAMHLLAADDLPSALLHWKRLPDEERIADELVTAETARFLGERLSRADETVAIGVAVADRLGHGRVHAIDDHVDDELGIATDLNEHLMAELEGTAAYAELAASPYFAEAGRRLPEAAATGDLLPMYRLINSREFLNEDVATQWHLFYRTELPSGRDRVRAALWEARNLAIASRIRAMSAWHPGGRVMVVIGAAHKPFLDRLLAQMMDVTVVQLAELLPAR